MLEIRTNCENCNKSLPNESSEAMICAYECTFCASCVEQTLSNVCPNCGGGFEKRPTRPKKKLVNFPVSEKLIFKPVTKNDFLKKNNLVDPRKR